MVKDTVTKEMMEAITTGSASAPTLTFTAYAVQYFNGTSSDGSQTSFTPAEAWSKLNN